MKKFTKKTLILSAVIMLISTFFITAYAAGGSVAEVAAEGAAVVTQADTTTGAKAIAAAVAIGLAAAAGALGMGIAIAKSVEGISRQPEAEGKIRTQLMLGLVFIETAIIYALIVSILIIFVL